MTPEEMQQRQRRFVDEAWVQGDLAVVDALVAPDIVHHVNGPHPGPGPQGVKDFISYIRSVFTDMHVTYQNEIAEGDKAMRHMTVHGVHSREFLGVAPTLRHVSFDVFDVNRFDEHGMMVEHWGFADLFAVLQQIGDEAPERPHAGV